MARVLRLPMNTRGRDFVVGDIHGAFDAVKEAMRLVRFDKDRDRLLALGDLVDRGAGSARCLEFLEQPYVSACRGNHDDFFATLDIAAIKMLAARNWNGMKWVLDVNEDRLRTICKYMQQLPIAMEVQTPRGLVGLVHADVPAGMSWQDFTAAIEQDDEAVITCALESRRRMQEHDTSGVAGVGRVFVGHTLQWKGPRRLGNVFAVDTGAVFREIGIADSEKELEASLSFLNVEFSTGSLQDLAHKEGLRVVDSRGVGPFGSSSKSAAAAAAAPAPAKRVGERLRA